MMLLRNIVLALILAGWGIPLIIAIYLTQSRINCLEMICSFPFESSIETALTITTVWIAVSFICLVILITKHKK
ncbi:MAG: hypothetical protein EP349_00980 [Alphaproteobacteria bacterium]|nr:MAG: hypothetical protein EP349_00980 [Alphaproteobacteria bacterium]